MDYSESVQAHVAGSCEHDNEYPGSIKPENFYISWELLASEEETCFTF
jgi:hypothetical protein